MAMFPNCPFRLNKPRNVSETLMTASCGTKLSRVAHVHIQCAKYFQIGSTLHM